MHPTVPQFGLVRSCDGDRPHAHDPLRGHPPAEQDVVQGVRVSLFLPRLYCKGFPCAMG